MIRKALRRLVDFQVNRKKRELISNHVINNGIILDGFTLDLRFPIQNKTYLEIGHGSAVACSFIYESGDGFIKVGDNSYIGNSQLISRSKILIGNYVTIAWGCCIYDHDSHSQDYLQRRVDIKTQFDNLLQNRNFIENKNWNPVPTAEIKILDDAWVGMNAIILKGVTIGRGAIVGAGSVVTRDVPDWSVVVGNPARIVKTFN